MINVITKMRWSCDVFGRRVRMIQISGTQTLSTSWPSKRIYIFLGAVLVVCPLFLSADSPRWPTCIATICFDRDLPDAVKTTKVFGEQEIRRGMDEQVLCYENNSRFLSLIVRNDGAPYIVDATISMNPICKDAVLTRYDFRKLKTAEGVGIGNNVSEVVKIYGAPNVVQIGEKDLTWSEAKEKILTGSCDAVLVYGPKDNHSLFQALISIHNRRIIELELSNTE